MSDAHMRHVLSRLQSVSDCQNTVQDIIPQAVIFSAVNADDKRRFFFRDLYQFIDDR